jgi:hypothetical protein
MPQPSPWNFLSAHHLPHQALTMVERSRSHCVLVTAYVDPWPSLALVIRQAVARGVAMHLVTRSEDCTHRSPAKRGKALEQIKSLGVAIHEVDWLHTKLYVSESEAIVTSLNLTSCGKDGPNLGVHLHGEQAAAQALAQIDQWIPNFARTVTSKSGSSRSHVTPGFCIRCRQHRKFYNPAKPYCSDCWHARKATRGHRTGVCCHSCGQTSSSSLRRPLCEECATPGAMQVAATC